jgi:RNA polymerase sigma factor (sigma-70 family)
LTKAAQLSPEAQRLVTEHRWLAESIAHKLVRQRRTFEMADDAQSEALLGLVEAARRFDPERGVLFKTYAQHWVKRHVWRYLYLFQRSVIQPKASDIGMVVSGLSQKERVLTQELGREPTTEEFAERFNLREITVRRAKQTMRSRDISIATTDAWGEESIVIQSNGPSPFDVVADAEASRDLKRHVDIALTKFDDRTAAILRRRLVANDDGGGDTLAAIGRDHGLTRERVRQIEAQYMPKLIRAVRRAMKECA